MEGSGRFGGARGARLDQAAVPQGEEDSADHSEGLAESVRFAEKIQTRSRTPLAPKGYMKAVRLSEMLCELRSSSMLLSPGRRSKTDVSGCGIHVGCRKWTRSSAVGSLHQPEGCRAGVPSASPRTTAGASHPRRLALTFRKRW